MINFPDLQIINDSIRLMLSEFDFVNKIMAISLLLCKNP